jgi:hypothetical protein
MTNLYALVRFETGALAALAGAAFVVAMGFAAAPAAAAGDVTKAFETCQTALNQDTGQALERFSLVRVNDAGGQTRLQLTARTTGGDALKARCTVGRDGAVAALEHNGVKAAQASAAGN